MGVSLGLDAGTIAVVVGVSGRSTSPSSTRAARSWTASVACGRPFPPWSSWARASSPCRSRTSCRRRPCGTRCSRRSGRRQRPVQRHPAHPRRRCGASDRPRGVPRILADPDGCRWRGGPVDRLGLDGRRVPVGRCRRDGSGRGLGAAGFIRWVPRYVPRSPLTAPHPREGPLPVASAPSATDSDPSRGRRAHSATRISTLPSAPCSTASCAAAVSSSTNHVSGKTGVLPDRQRSVGDGGRDVFGGGEQRPLPHRVQQQALPAHVLRAKLSRARAVKSAPPLSA